MRELIHCGADVKLSNKFGETSLYWAAFSGCVDCIRELVAAGADVNDVNAVCLTTAVFGPLNVNHMFICERSLERRDSTPLCSFE